MAPSIEKKKTAPVTDDVTAVEQQIDQQRAEEQARKKLEKKLKKKNKKAKAQENGTVDASLPATAAAAVDSFSADVASPSDVPSVPAAKDIPAHQEPSQKEDKKEKKKDKKDKKKDKKKRSLEVDESSEAPKKKRVDSCATETSSLQTSNDTQVDVHAWMQENEVVITDPTRQDASWAPFLRFEQAALPPQIMKAVAKFDKPTLIQSTCWPIALAKRDVIGIAETGSGKTMGFGIPALVHISQKHGGKAKSKRPVCLALAPTRELAMQIHEQMEQAGKPCGVTSLCVYGGVPKEEQRRVLRQGVHVVIACPGRLMDLVQEEAMSLGDVDFVVLDEADRMLDMGFEQEVRSILTQTSPRRQTLMFSATWPASIQKLAHEFLQKDAVKVTVGSPDLGANQNIKQIVEVLQDPRDKEQRLVRLLEQYHRTRKNRVLVFALYKKEADRLEQMLNRRGWNCVAIHGDMSQSQRTQNFQQFKSGQVPLLIATDVAARGLDIPNVEYVINVTFPLTIEDYVHRIGRTGRAGKTGTAHTFFTAHEKARSGELINVLKDAGQPVPENLMAFGTTVKKKEHSTYGAFFRDVDPNTKGTKITFGEDDD